MSREIKFRAWDGNKMYRCGVTMGGLAIGKFEPERACLMQYTGLKDKNGIEIYEGDILMFPDTESEYIDTGVGAGQKVAETEVNNWGEVKFQEGTFGIDVLHKPETLYKGWNSFWYILHEYGFGVEELEVIGNIYENPKLLK